MLYRVTIHPAGECDQQHADNLHRLFQWSISGSATTITEGQVGDTPRKHPLTCIGCVRDATTHSSATLTRTRMRSVTLAMTRIKTDPITQTQQTYTPHG